MKFITFSTQDKERRLGILIEHNVYAVQDLDATLPDQMEKFIENAQHNLSVLQKACDDYVSTKSYDLENVTLHAPIQKPGSVRDFIAFENHLLNASKKNGITIAPQWYEFTVVYFICYKT